MSRSYRVLALALVSMLVLVGLAKAIGRSDTSSSVVPVAAAAGDEASGTSTTGPAPVDTATSAPSTATDTVTEPTDGDVAPSTSHAVDTTASPARSGAADTDCPASGHGAVIDRINQRGALCADGRITYRFPITSAWSQPDPGTYPVYAKDLHASSTFGGHYSTMTHFVAFTRGKYKGARIAFHSVPTLNDGSYVQPLDSVGTEAMHGKSSGCIRVLPNDSVTIWNWLAKGDKVRVIS
jgi:hypothetical protein